MTFFVIYTTLTAISKWNFVKNEFGNENINQILVITESDDWYLTKLWEVNQIIHIIEWLTSWG